MKFMPPERYFAPYCAMGYRSVFMLLLGRHIASYIFVDVPCLCTCTIPSCLSHEHMLFLSDFISMINRVLECTAKPIVLI